LPFRRRFLGFFSYLFGSAIGLASFWNGQDKTFRTTGRFIFFFLGVFAKEASKKQKFWKLSNLK
jgi:hypothetical protein